MLDFITPYWLLGFVLPPSLFLLWNYWRLSRLAHIILMGWRKKEAHFLKVWSLASRGKAEVEIKGHIRRNLQSTLFLSFVFLATLVILLLVLEFSTLGPLSNVVWLLPLISMHFHLKRKSREVAKNGIPFHQIVQHSRIKNVLLVGDEFKGSIVFPYLFTISYQRSLEIESEFSEAIQNSSSAEEGKMLVSLLAKEDEYLVKDMVNALMGRSPKEPESTENTEALTTLLSHAQDSSLPTKTRYDAMNLASELQKMK